MLSITGAALVSVKATPGHRKLGAIHDQFLFALPAVRYALLREKAREDLIVIAALGSGGAQ